jgi:hypothetical protein
LGASDRDIHDTVLIAAPFACSTATWMAGCDKQPTDLSTYPPRAKQVAANGYGTHIFKAKQPTI